MIDNRQWCVDSSHPKQARIGHNNVRSSFLFLDSLWPSSPNIWLHWCRHTWRQGIEESDQTWWYMAWQTAKHTHHVVRGTHILQKGSITYTRTRVRSTRHTWISTTPDLPLNAHGSASRPFGTRPAPSPHRSKLWTRQSVLVTIQYDNITCSNICCSQRFKKKRSTLKYSFHIM